MGRTYVFVGSWTSHPDATDGGIRVFELGADGSLTLLDTIAPDVNAGSLALSPDGRSLYVVDERRDSPGRGYAGGSVASFTFDRLGGSLSQVRMSPTCAALPCHLSASPAGDLVAVANHGSYEYIVTTALGDGFRAQRAFDSGAVALFSVDEDGSLGGAADVVVLEARDEGSRAAVLTDPSGQFTGEFQASSHPHAAAFHPTAPILVVPDKGTDVVVVMQVDAAARRLHPVHRWQSERGSGPRHAAFHPTLPVIYIVNELVPSLTVLAWDAAAERIRPLQSVPTIPDAVVGTWPSELVVHPSGRFVHVSNRGHDSIATFPVRPDGTLGAAHFVGCGGRIPRAFAIDPSGTWLFVLNQGSGTIVSFAIDAYGSPTPTGAVASVDRPVSIAVGR